MSNILMLNQVPMKRFVIVFLIMLDLVMKMVIAAMLQVELNAPILFVDPPKVSSLFFK